MANMTLSMPDEVMALIKKHNHIKWSEIARRAIVTEAEKIEKLARVDEILAKSDITEKDALEIGLKMKKGIARRHGLIVK